MESDRSPAVQANDFEAWPVLPLESWEETYATLHRWMQIIGKIRLALCADVNHWWQATLYVTPRGLTTGPMPYGQRMFQMDFDFLKHELRVTTADDGVAPSRCYPGPSLIFITRRWRHWLRFVFPLRFGPLPLKWRTGRRLRKITNMPRMFLSMRNAAGVSCCRPIEC